MNRFVFFFYSNYFFASLEDDEQQSDFETCEKENLWKHRPFADISGFVDHLHISNFCLPDIRVSKSGKVEG